MKSFLPIDARAADRHSPPLPFFTATMGRSGGLFPAGIRRVAACPSRIAIRNIHEHDTESW